MKQWDLHRTELLQDREWSKLKRFLDDESDLAELNGNRTAIQNRVICYVAVWAGLRRAEIASLDLDDLYLTNDSPFLVVKDGKGGKRREVMISPILRAILKKFIRGMEPGPVFRPQRGERYTGNGLWRVWAVACAGAGILPRSIHKARHFYGQKQYEATNDLRFVQKQLGHSRIVTTQVYVEISNTKAVENLAGLDKVLRA